MKTGPNRLTRTGPVTCFRAKPSLGFRPRFHFGFRFDLYLGFADRFSLMIPDLEKITVPVLLTAGSKDMIKKEDTEFLHESIKGSRLMILEGESHESYILDSDKIASIIQSFLSELLLE